MSNRETIDRIAHENRYELSNQRKLKVSKAITRIIDIWDPTHFIFELLQNADDVNATVVNYYFDDSGMIFTHNGKDFEENEVEALCSISDSTKNIITQIGFMGMGFKSVFKITDNPQIISETYRFNFSKEGYDSDDDGWVFIPKWIEVIQDNIKFVYSDGFTNFILPFKNDLDQEVKEDIKTFLNKIEPISIAFLNHITNINVYFDWILKLKINKIGSSIIFEKNNEKNIISFKSFVKSFPVPESLRKNEKIRRKHRDKIKEVPVILAVLFDKNGKFIEKSLPFYSFLPTEQITGLKFILQTDFILNSKRTSLDKEILKWNAWLIECAESILWEVIEEFKSDKNLQTDFYSILPNESNDELIKKHFIELFIKGCKDQNFILTSDNQWKKPNEVVWASQIIQNLIPTSILPKKSAGRRYYVHPNLKIVQSLRQKLELFEPDEFTLIWGTLLDAEWLKSQSTEWFNLLYEFLYDRLFNEDQNKRWKDSWKKKEELGTFKIVKDTKCHLQIPSEVLFKPINENFDEINEIPDIKFTDVLEPSKSGQLLNKFGVKNFSAVSVIEKILASYQNNKWYNWTSNELTNSNKFIEMWLSNNKMQIPINSPIKKEKLGSIRLVCDNGNWEKAEECYFPDAKLKNILPNALFLTDTTEYNVEFLIYIGVESKPRIVNIGVRLNNDKGITSHWEKYWIWIGGERGTFWGDKVDVCFLAGFDKAIELKNKELMQIFLQFIIENWKQYKSYLKCKYNYPEKNNYLTKDISSYFAFQLKELIWLPSTKNLVKPIETVFVPTKKIKHIGKDLLVYVDLDEQLVEKGMDFFEEIGLTGEINLGVLLSLLKIIRETSEQKLANQDFEQQRRYFQKIKEILYNIYKEIYKRVEDNSDYEEYSQNLYLLDTNDKFTSVKELYWKDDAKLGKIFEGLVNFLWIPDDINFQGDLVRFFKIDKISDKVNITVQESSEKEFDKDLTHILKSKSVFLESLLFFYKKDNKILDFFEQAEAYTVNKTEKILILNSKKINFAGDPISVDIQKRKIYRRAESTRWDLALEITSIFRINQSNAPLIENILEKPINELNDRFEKMNIPIIGTILSEPKDVEEIIEEKANKEPTNIEHETISDNDGEKESEIDEDESTAGESEADLVIPSKLIEKSRTTIRNKVKDEPPYLFNGEIVDKNHEHKPPVKPESARETKNKTEISKLEVERIAREIVLSFEKKAGRNAKDCSGNKCGYDIISYDGNSERYIEIKGSKNDYPSFSISGNEWHAAEELKDKYYIYRVAYIKRSQNHTTITIIKNPAEQLATTKKEILEIIDWHRAFEEAETVEFEEENENNGA